MKSFFKLTQIATDDGKTWDNPPRYPDYDIMMYKVFYFPTREEAERAIAALVLRGLDKSEKVSSLCFRLLEIPFNVEEYASLSGFGFELLSWRLYDSKGRLIDFSVTKSEGISEWKSVEEDFPGYEPSKYRFAPGDLVEVINLSEKKSHLAVVMDTPLSIEGVKKFNCKGCKLDSTDESYTIVDAPTYASHDHVSPLYLLAPQFPVPQETERYLKECYNKISESDYQI